MFGYQKLRVLKIAQSMDADHPPGTWKDNEMKKTKTKKKKHRILKHTKIKSRVVDLSDMPDDFWKTKYEIMFDYVKKNNGVTIAQLAREFKAPESNVRRFLHHQVDNGGIEKVKCQCGQGNLFK